jgi:UDP-N-acetylbacillosamine N-acetyltransferase
MKMTYNSYVNVLKSASRIIIHGAGGNTRTIIGILLNQGCSGKLFCIDKAIVPDETILGVPVAASLDFNSTDIHLVSYGDLKIRTKKFNELKNKGLNIGNCIADDSVIYNTQILSALNNQIFNRAYIGPGAIIGNNNIINTGAIIEHEVSILDNNHIAPGCVICGRVKIGSNVFAGANAVVRDKITICDNVIIGAGSVVIRDINEPGVYVGNPVRKLS